MNVIKSIYLTWFVAAAWLGLIIAAMGVAEQGLASPWIGTVIACGVPALFFGLIFIIPTARTSANLHWMPVSGVIGAAVSAYLAGGINDAVQTAVGVGIIGNLLYIHWYSRFAPPPRSTPDVGSQMPEFILAENGKAVSSAALTAKPALWIFFRGNWCPLCMAQIKEIAGQYQALSRRGVDVLLISPQKASNSASLAKKFDVPMRFLTDTDNNVAGQLGIVQRGGLPTGMQALGYDSDVPRPSVFITAAGGKVIFRDLTDNYRVRPEPSQFFAVLDQHAIT
ncbi:MAG: redoxin domain-containing protein [Panacagrimonas sp.]